MTAGDPIMPPSGATPATECIHGESLDGLCNACADRYGDPNRMTATGLVTEQPATELTPFEEGAWIDEYHAKLVAIEKTAHACGDWGEDDDETYEQVYARLSDAKADLHNHVQGLLAELRAVASTSPASAPEPTPTISRNDVGADARCPDPLCRGLLRDYETERGTVACRRCGKEWKLDDSRAASPAASAPEGTPPTFEEHSATCFACREGPKSCGIGLRLIADGGRAASPASKWASEEEQGEIYDAINTAYEPVSASVARSASDGLRRCGSDVPFPSRRRTRNLPNE